MASRLTRTEVLRIAELAHLELSETEVDLFTRQLDDILSYAEQVQDVDTAGVSPTSHALATGAVWRDDVVQGSLSHDESLPNAPDADRSAGLFKVPKVL
jgi:aspartyl-tRNA(Asn)/glutamyl-tRNA(Gln) amidotransferase subunit C